MAYKVQTQLNTNKTGPVFTQPIILNFNFSGCSDLEGFHSVEHAIFTNVSGAKCDSGIWDSVQEGPDAGEQERKYQVGRPLVSKVLLTVF